jgi:hypothetical protein
MNISRKILIIALTTAAVLPVASAAVVPAATASGAVVSCHYSAGVQTETTTDSAGHETTHKSIVIYRVCGHYASEVGSIQLS